MEYIPTTVTRLPGTILSHKYLEKKKSIVQEQTEFRLVDLFMLLMSHYKQRMKVVIPFLYMLMYNQLIQLCIKLTWFTKYFKIHKKTCHTKKTIFTPSGL